MLDFTQKLREHDIATGVLKAAVGSGAHDNASLDALLDWREIERTGLVVLSAVYQVDCEQSRKAEEMKRLQESAANK